jgi:hypothetical protein
MHLGTRKQADAAVVPLQNAVLCLDCECVTNGRFDECLVCGGRSLLSIARLLGGTLQSGDPDCPQRDESIVRFDLKITIDMMHLESNELNNAVDGIARLIALSLGQGRARCHINVEPVIVQPAAVNGNADGSKAA